MSHRHYPADSRDAGIHTASERHTLFVLGLAIMFFAVTGFVAGAAIYFGG